MNINDIESKVSPLARTIREHLGLRLHKGELSSLDVIYIIDVFMLYGNCCTVSVYAKRENISYNGALDRIKSGKVQCFDFFGERFVIYND